MSQIKDITKEYTNGEVTVVWRPRMCMHSTKCFKGLPQVFDVQKRPWVNAEGASTGEIIAQINKCPSGALSYYLNAEGKPENEVYLGEIVQMEAAKNGPFLMKGNIRIVNSDGNVIEKQGNTSLCRCGASGNKPFCDGSHKKSGFEG